MTHSFTGDANVFTSPTSPLPDQSKPDAVGILANAHPLRGQILYGEPAFLVAWGTPIWDVI